MTGVRILAVADAEERALGEHFNPDRWGRIDLVISCGDLDPNYLDYLVTRFNTPLFYVRGNHDASYVDQPPGGCENLDGHVRRFSGLRIAGLEGSRWYGGSGVEYTDSSMRWRTRLLDLRIRMARGIDILVTHAPPAMPDGSEATDRLHRGFHCFSDLIQRHQPQLALHGHTHLGYGSGVRQRTLNSTRVIDCYRHTIVEL
ncbi:MAG: metallophosphoesterase [Chloroflexota bacterium]|nr:MAG: metallophosphoesterase [Chloroflexota bacterium]